MGHKEFEAVKAELRKHGRLGETINDGVFGELTEIKETSVWIKEEKVVFGGKEVLAELSVYGEESEGNNLFAQRQYEAYKMLKAKWDDVQQLVLEAILQYYIELREELGYAEEENEDYPEISTTGQLQEYITLDEVKLLPENFDEDHRYVGLGFDCSWDKYNGVGVILVDETVDDIGYEDIIW